MASHDRLLSRLSRTLVRHPRLVSALCVLSLFPTVLLASKLVLHENFDELLSPSYPAVADFDAVAHKTGGTAFVLVAVGAHDLPLAQRFAQAMERDLTGLSTVYYVDAHLPLEFIKDHLLLYVPTPRLRRMVADVRRGVARAAAERSGFYINLEDSGRSDQPVLDTPAINAQLNLDNFPLREYVVGNDGKYLYVMVRLRGEAGNLRFGQRALNQVESHVRALRDGKAFPRDLPLRFAGPVVDRLEEHHILLRDLRRAGVLGFLLVVGLIVVYTRRWRTLVLIAAPLLVGIAWTLAYARLAVGHLNIITGFLVSVLFGLGIDFGVHLFLRYQEERRRGADEIAATQLSVVSTGSAVIAGAVTTAAAFYVVRFAKFRGYSEFGIIAGAGILLMLVVSLLLFPTLNLLWDARWPMRLRPLPAAKQEIHIRPALRWAFVGCVLLFTAFSIQQIAHGELEFHTNWRQLKGESPASTFDDYIVKSLGRSLTLTLAYVPSIADISPVQDAVAAVRQQRRAAGKSVGVVDTLSMRDVVPPDQAQRKVLMGELATQLRRIRPRDLVAADRPVWHRIMKLTRAQPFTAAEVPEPLKRRFQTSDGQGTFMFFLTDYRFYDYRQAIAWAHQMRAIEQQAAGRGVAVRIMSENWIMGSIMELIVGDAAFILWATFLAVFVVLLVHFRSFKDALAVMLPLIVGVICIAGAMALTGVQLNAINAVVVPTIIGIGIDNAIHVYHRYRERGRGSVPWVLRHSGSATLLASMTTMFGFGAMIIAHHRGIRSVAELAILGISTTYVCTSVFFPLVLQILEGRRSSPRRRDEPRHERRLHPPPVTHDSERVYRR